MIYGFARQSNGQVRSTPRSAKARWCAYIRRGILATRRIRIRPRPGGRSTAEQGETVLVVDDEATVRMLVKEVLEDLGYTAIEAADGESGLKVLQSDVRLDLLVTDLRFQA